VASSAGRDDRCVGRELERHGVLAEDTMELSARKTLAELGVSTVPSVRQPVGLLSGGQRQVVEAGVHGRARGGPAHPAGDVDKATLIELMITGRSSRIGPRRTE
jgi:hypothetical protein